MVLALALCPPSCLRHEVHTLKVQSCRQQAWDINKLPTTEKNELPLVKALLLVSVSCRDMQVLQSIEGEGGLPARGPYKVQ